MRTPCTWALLAIVAAAAITRPARAQRPNSEASKVTDALKKLRPGHPRLMLTDEGLADLKARYKGDPALQRCVRDMLARADACLRKPPLTYAKIGPRLLRVSRDCLGRTYALALAWRWTGKAAYAEAATENLLTVCAFPNWNPSHFLDTAEMSHAVGVGYDWLYATLTEDQRKSIRDGLIRHGLTPGINAYTGRRAWWVRSAFNWNQVCNGGLIVGALAIAETDPEYARAILPAAIKSLPTALRSYAPDGAWMEGPGYWHYASRYTASGLTALQTALGDDLGLSKTDGLAAAAWFPIYTTGPSGMFLNFADSGERSARRPMPCMFWFARTYGQPALADAEHAAIAARGARPGHLIWYVPPSGATPPPRSLDRQFRGRVAVAVFRSAWDDPAALFVGVKAGYNQVNHGHLDLGNFEVDALGVRWARDLGSDNYNLPGYWDSKPGGRRWRYYRLNSRSHNVPLLDGADQDPAAVATFVRFRSDASGGRVVIDLTGAYPAATKVTRGVALIAGRRAVLVQDEFQLPRPCKLLWGMTTDAAITLRDDGSAELTLKGKRLLARILSPAGAKFEVASAAQQPPQKPNTGVRRLQVPLAAPKGATTVAILLSPVWPDGPTTDTTPVKPLAKW